MHRKAGASTLVCISKHYVNMIGWTLWLPTTLCRATLKSGNFILNSYV